MDHYKHNCGIYTGEPFLEGSSWACVPMPTDSYSIVTDEIPRSCPKPPPGAERQQISLRRPGNNEQPSRLAAVNGTVPCPALYPFDRVPAVIPTSGEDMPDDTFVNYWTFQRR